MTFPALLLPLPNSRAARLLTTMATCLAIVMLIVLTVFISTTQRRVQSDNALSDQVAVVQLASQKLFSSLQDAETSQRGYLLTGDPSYLAPYAAARDRLDTDFAQLDAAPLSTPERAAQITLLRTLAATKLAQLAAAIALYQAGNPPAAIATVRTNHEKATMRAIRAEVALLQSTTQVRLLQGRTGIYAPWTRAMEITTGTLAALLLLGVAWSRYRMQADVDSKFSELGRFRQGFGLAPATLRGLDGRILFWNTGAQHLYGYSSEEALGQIDQTFLHIKFPESFEAITAILRRDGEWQGELLCQHRDGHDLYVLSHWALSHGETGELDAYIVVSSDVTATRLAERERERASALLRTIVDAAPGLIYAKDREGRMLLANPPALALIGRPWSEIAGLTDLQFLDSVEQGEAVMTNDRRIMEDAQTEEFEEVVGNVNNDGARPRIWSSTKSPLRDESGAVIGLVGMSFEITERKRIEERLHLMVDELNHRVKNTLATVQAIAAQSLRGGDPDIRYTLERRLLSLAAAHDVLTRESWEGASLHDIVAGALALFGRDGGRFTVSGPPLHILPRAALALAMCLHELLTNAIKHGALSSLSGVVNIHWEIIDRPEPTLSMRWTERGGPLVKVPARRGFGISLLERSLAQDLGGTLTVMFDDPSGITALGEVPLSEVVVSAEIVPLPRVGQARRGR